MFCIKCGRPTEDGKTMCDACAAQELAYNPVAEPAYQSAPEPVYQPAAEPVYQPAAEPVYQPAAEPVYQHPVEPVYQSAPQNYYQNPAEPVYQSAPSFELNNPAETGKKAKKAKKAKSGKKGFPVGGIVAAVAVVGVAAAAFFCWDSIVSFFMRSFASPEDYMSHVEQKAAEDTINDITTIYGDILGAMGGETETEDYAVKSDIQLTIGDEILDVLQSSMTASGMDMDLSWLSNIKLSGYVGSNEDLMKADLGIGLGNTTVATISYLMDLGESTMYLGIPELSDTYLQLNLEDIPGVTEDMEEIENQLNQMQDMMDEIVKLLPAEEKLNEVLVRYWGIVLANLEDVEKSTETVEAGGLEQKLNVIECTITQEGLYNIVIAILEDLQNDKEMMECVYAIAELSGADEDMVDEAIDMALESMEDMAKDADNDNRINLTTYVDNSDKIVGRTIEVEGSDMDPVKMYYITVWEKDEFAFEANVADQMEIIGSGSREKKLISGEYALEVQGMEVVTLEIADYDEKAAEEGYLNGVFTIAPGSDLADLVTGAMGSPVDPEDDYYGSYEAYPSASSSTSSVVGAILNFELELSFVNTESNSEFGMVMKAAGVDVIGIKVTAEKVEPTDVKIPKDSVELDMEDPASIQEWVLGMDFEKVVSNLEKAGLPAELMEYVYEFVDQFEELG